MPYRTCELSIVLDGGRECPRTLTIDASAPAVQTYMRQRAERSGDPPETYPAAWQRTVETFAEHVPAGHHLVKVHVTSEPAAAPVDKIERVALALATYIQDVEMRHNLAEINQIDQLETWKAAYPVKVTDHHRALARVAIEATEQGT